MDVPLNLTEVRGPSVWDTPSRPEHSWQGIATTTGLLLVTSAWPFRSRSSRVIAAVGVLGVALGLSGKRLPEVMASIRDWHADDAANEAKMDSTLAQSFPASDPPSH